MTTEWYALICAIETDLFTSCHNMYFIHCKLNKVYTIFSHVKRTEATLSITQYTVIKKCLVYLHWANRSFSALIHFRFQYPCQATIHKRLIFTSRNILLKFCIKFLKSYINYIKTWGHILCSPACNWRGLSSYDCLHHLQKIIEFLWASSNVQSCPYSPQLSSKSGDKFNQQQDSGLKGRL